MDIGGFRRVLISAKAEIREDGLAGFKSATIDWSKAQDALKYQKKSEARAKPEVEAQFELKPEVESNSYEITFEGASAESCQSVQTEPSEKSIDCPKSTPAPQPVKKTIHQKLQDIADRANAKKREIDEAMNLEMVALFSSEQATARNARKLGMPESSPTPGAMVCGFS
jgi:hypothetical protein